MDAPRVLSERAGPPIQGQAATRGVRDLTRIGRRLAWLLRHAAVEQGLAMDQAGWVAVPAILQALDLPRSELERLVAGDAKRRYQLVAERIRACQGHSLENRAVRIEALEASWAEYFGEASIWHGTTLKAIEEIARDGILPRARTHVHCAPHPESNVGKRSASEVLVEISPTRLRTAGERLFLAPNGVILTRHVPVTAIVGWVAVRPRAQARLEALRMSLGLSR